ncbi:hypothetical protein ONZ51_g376 [Trametes cubensis]|uniref:Retrotransposon gag domain-containing protein n=1 Tax=Trametes cubensis TaxID=1111947 RepID=A0AAD7XE10_9APHY|nr:hypothetical protein ONZ51_g376 [Trametes cubensis]
MSVPPNPGYDVVRTVAAGANSYQDSLSNCLRRNIEFKVGSRLPALPDGVKQPKVDNPSKYRGKHDHKAFYTWLDGYLSWLRAYNICGEETDKMRVQLMRNYVTGPAEEWFMAEVDHLDITHRPQFQEVVCAMHRHFVHVTTAAKATKDSEQCRYRSSEGVDRFVAEIKKYAGRMVQSPSDYNIARKFVYGLPTDIFEVVVVHRGLRPEFYHINEIAVYALSHTNLDWYLDMAESVQVSGNGLAKSHVPDLSKRMTEQQRDHQRGTDAQSVSFSLSPIMVGVSFDLPLAVQHAIPRDVQPDQIPRCPVVAYGLDHHVFSDPTVSSRIGYDQSR